MSEIRQNIVFIGFCLMVLAILGVVACQVVTEETTPFQTCTEPGEVIEYHEGGPSHGDYAFGFQIKKTGEKILYLHPVICMGNAGLWETSEFNEVTAEEISYVVEEASNGCNIQGLDVITTVPYTSHHKGTFVKVIVLICGE